MTTMIGIDPHKATHMAVAVDSDEGVLGQLEVSASMSQVDELRQWAHEFGERCWAVESASGLGYLVAQQLVAAGETVFDVAPLLASRVRLLGSGHSQKNDVNDARSVAIVALRSDRPVVVCADTDHAVLRLLAKRHRDLAQFRSKYCNQLHAVVLELEAGGIGSKITVVKANALLDRVIVDDEVTRHRVMIAAELVAEIDRLDSALKTSRQRITTAVTASGTSLTNIVGVGPICAAIIVGYTGDIARFRTKSQFASYNATAPIEASSGPNAKHRLNPRGNRKINYAIHIAALSQIRHATEGRVYYDRKVAEGKSSKEALRALKRQISDRVYKCLVADASDRTSN